PLARLRRGPDRHVANAPRGALPADRCDQLAVLAIVETLERFLTTEPAVSDLVVPVVEVVVVHRLEDVALLDVATIPRHADTIFTEELVIPREERLSVRWAHVREDESPHLDARVGKLLHRVLEHALRGLSGSFEAVAVMVVEPTMVQASEAALLDPAIRERGAAVAAVLTQEAGPTRRIPEEHEVLPKDLHPERVGGTGGFSILPEICRALHREPVAAKDLTRGRPGPDADEFLFLAILEHQHASCSLALVVPGHQLRPCLRWFYRSDNLKSNRLFGDFHNRIRIGADSEERVGAGAQERGADGGGDDPDGVRPAGCGECQRAVEARGGRVPRPVPAPGGAAGRCRGRGAGLPGLPAGALAADLVEQSAGATEQGGEAADRCGGHLPE